MRKSIFLILLALLVSLFMACEKDSDIDTPDDNQVVDRISLKIHILSALAQSFSSYRIDAVFGL
jgi:hypothetical protein